MLGRPPAEQHEGHADEEAERRAKLAEEAEAKFAIDDEKRERALAGFGCIYFHGG